MDVRIQTFRLEMDKLEDELNLRFESFDAFKDQMYKNLPITCLSFVITRDKNYNDDNSFMVTVYDPMIKYPRRVLVVIVEDKIVLNVRGV